MSSRKTLGRRRFLASAGKATLGLPVLMYPSLWGNGVNVPPSEKIGMGVIGLGIRGTKNMRRFLAHDDVRVVAVCDVFRGQREQAKGIVDAHYRDKGCKAYNDFRELIARNDIDAVVVTAPDHWHVLIGLAAARAGKDMYFEKPIGLSLEHAQALRRAVQKHKNIFQFGTQQRSDRKFRIACELVRNGRIGELKAIHVGAPASMAIPSQPSMPVPEGLDYEMWLGPAPWAPYTYQRCRPHNPKEGYSAWYHISHYCLGFIGNWGVHHLDIAQWGNGTGHTAPVSVEGTGEFPGEGIADCCVKWELEFHYKNGVRMLYTDNRGRCKQGVRFEGSEGWIHVNRQELIAQPESMRTSRIGSNEVHLPVSDDHYRNFLDAVKARKQPICPVENAVRSDTICQMANIATRLQRKLQWDPDDERFVGDDEANRMLSRPLRAPWKIDA